MSESRGWVFPVVLVGSMACIGFIGTFGVEVLTTGRLSDVDDPQRFYFSKHVQHATERVGPGWRYVSTRATGVKPDGSMDLTAPYKPTVSYLWRGESAPAEAMPLGAGVDVKVPVVLVEVVAPGWHVASQRQGKTSHRWSRGIERRELAFEANTVDKLGAAPPTCDFKALWDEALAAGAPANAVASISHDAQGYALRIDRTRHHYTFDHACKRTK